MSFREFGETAVIYLTGAVGEPLQSSNKGLNFGNQISRQNTPDGSWTIGGNGLLPSELNRPARQVGYKSTSQFLHRNQRHPPDHTSWKEIAMARDNYIDGRHEDLINGEEESGGAAVLIQSHGAAIVIKAPELIILQVSANTSAHFGFAPEELLGRPLSLLLGAREFQRLREEFLSEDLD